MGVFHFKQFDIDDSGCGMKICSDSVLLGAWFFPRHKCARRVADVGAGSGLLSLMAAQILPGASIAGLEIDSDAARAARANFNASPWADRLAIVEGNFADYSAAEPFDLIISNPPYFASGEKACDQARATARHQASLSYSSLLDYAKAHLAPNGHLGLIAPAEQTDEIIFNAELKGLKLRRMCDICAREGRQAGRTMFDFALADGDTHSETLHIRQSDGTLHPLYTAIVEPFYTKIS